MAAKKKVKETSSKTAKVKVTRDKLDKMKDSITAVFEGQQLVGEKREYDSGSTGYNVTGKIVVDGVRCQVSCHVIAIGSKDVK